MMNGITTLASRAMKAPVDTPVNGRMADMRERGKRAKNEGQTNEREREREENKQEQLNCLLPLDGCAEEERRKKKGNLPPSFFPLHSRKRLFC
jgi:hypothetical protein